MIDHGDGIKPEMHNLVFQEFAQVDGGPTRQQEGTGLGLPITRHLVEMHDGRIWIESDGTPGAGAAFHFTIPVITSADPCALIPDTAADREQQASLIVEGDR